MPGKQKRGPERKAVGNSPKFPETKADVVKFCLLMQHTLSTWFKWERDSPGPDNRISGSVCGQDPRYCKRPVHSPGAFVWEDDISLWPVSVGSKQKQCFGPHEKQMHTFLKRKNQLQIPIIKTRTFSFLEKNWSV